MEKELLKKVRCSVCENEVEAHCAVKKNVKIKVNKGRRCKFYVHVPDKEKVKKEINIVSMPSWYWIRDLRRKMFKQLAEQKAKANTASTVQNVPSYLETSIPTENPDCLANFRSSAESVDEAKEDSNDV